VPFNMKKSLFVGILTIIVTVVIITIFIRTCTTKVYIFTVEASSLLALTCARVSIL
jgi:hypothetical protein